MANRLGMANLFNIYCRKISTVTNGYSILDVILSKPMGNQITVKGWVKSLRKMKHFSFININDGSCCDSLQIVIPKTLLNKSLQMGMAVKVTGKIQTNPNNQLELFAENFNAVGELDVTDNFPFVFKQKQSYDHYRQYLHLRPKIDYFTSVMRFRSAASLKIHQYFDENGFIHVHTPVITSADCEGGGETFTIKPRSEELIKKMKNKDVPNENVFFNSPAYLTVSGQLHLEAVVRSISKVYSFNPSFRAENSKSRLHLSEFYMVEAEEAFITDLNSILFRIEDCVKQITSYLLEKNLKDIEYILKHNNTDLKEQINLLEDITNKPFSVMTFTEAKSVTEKNFKKFSGSEIIEPFSLNKEEELFLVQNNNNMPLFIIDWPSFKKPFYMKPSSHNSELVSGVDLLVPSVGELCGGSLREDSYDVLLEKLTSLDMLESLSWYLELRKFGNVPSGGFGLGFERLIQFLLNIQNIKDAIPFPRWPHSLQL